MLVLVARTIHCRLRPRNTNSPQLTRPPPYIHCKIRRDSPPLLASPCPSFLFPFSAPFLSHPFHSIHPLPKPDKWFGTAAVSSRAGNFRRTRNAPVTNSAPGTYFNVHMPLSPVTDVPGQTSVVYCARNSAEPLAADTDTWHKACPRLSGHVVVFTFCHSPCGMAVLALSAAH